MSLTPSIHLLLDAGLGNRLQGLAAGILYSRLLDQTPIINWPANVDCNSLIGNLFSISEKTWISYDSQIWSEDHEGSAILLTMNRELGLHNLPYSESFKKDISAVRYIKPLAELDPRTWEGYQRVIINPFHYFWLPSSSRRMVEDVFAEFKQGDFLSPSIVQRFKSVSSQMAGLKSSIAIHARRPYWHRATPKEEMVHSPNKISDQDYLDLVAFTLDIDSSIRVYFCSNQTELESKALQKFGSRVIVFNKLAVANNDEKAISDALVEILLMSEARHVIASSSFSASAALIGSTSYTWIGPGCDRDVAIRESQKSIQKALGACQESTQSP